MNKLFISDLDGTLFNSDAELTDFTAEVINSLTERGISFTYATARSERSAIDMTSKLKLNMPCVLMNGVIIYDTEKKAYEKAEYISEKLSAEIASLYEKHNVKGHLYRISGGNLKSYTTLENDDMLVYEYHKSFYDILGIDKENLPIYFTANDAYEILLPLKNDVSEIEGTDFTFYEDTYTGKWYLEIFSDKASKANAVKYLREKYKFDKVTAFGDNLNDLSLFREADVKIAVANAKQELKNSADFVIGSNDDDGVAKWLKNYMKGLF